jgi:hypothetical protein
MTTIEQVFEHKWLDWPTASLSVSLDDIAARFGLEPDSWNEDGLGPSQRVFIRLPSGRIALIRERAHLVKHYGAGPDFAVDVADVVTFGVSRLIDEVLSALGLSESAVAWNADENTRQSAAPILTAWRARS